MWDHRFFGHRLMFCWEPWVFTLFEKTIILSYVWNKVPEAKWPHWPCGHIMCLSKNHFHDGIYQQNLDLLGPTPFLFCLYNEFILKEVCFLCGQYIQYIYNIAIIDDIFLVKQNKMSVVNVYFFVRDKLWLSDKRK